MNTAIEASIIEQLHRLDEQHKAEVLNFVEYLAQKSNAATATKEWPTIDPARDLAKFIGKHPFPEDGVAYQRRIRDSEWT